MEKSFFFSIFGNNIAKKKVNNASKMKLLQIKNFSISQKVLVASTLLIIFLVFNVVSSIFLLRENRDVVAYSLKIISPSLEDIKDLQDLILKSRMYSVQWLNNSQSEDDKDALREIHTFEFPKIKDELSILKKKWQSEEAINELDSIIILFDVVLQAQESIMDGYLVTPQDYQNTQKVDEAKKILTYIIEPQTKKILARLKKISDQKMTEKQNYISGVDAKFKRLENIFLILGLILIATGMLSTWYVFSHISKPINSISQLLTELSKGIIPEQKEQNFSKDEIGTMANAAYTLIDGFKETSKFAENIGKGTFDYNFKPLSENDILGNSLIEMRNNLSKIAEEDNKRNWIAQGLAKFADILRSSQQDLSVFSDLVISSLVNYIDANQGGVFIYTEDEFGDAPFLELTGCYAWGRRKYMEKKIYFGDGLIGQAWQSREAIYMTDIPANYVQITSGLGEANPTSLLIAPIQTSEQVFGVVELYFFSVIPDYKIDFVKRICDSMAVTLASVKTNQRTQDLLRESQELAEQMRAQEEEMRQNMEELQATQETAERKTVEAESRLSAINNSVAMLELDENGFVISINGRFLELAGFREEDILNKHQSTFIKKTPENTAELNLLWEKMKLGEVVEGNFERETKKGKQFSIRGTYFPVIDAYNRLEKVIHIATDITNQKEQAVLLSKSNEEMQSLIRQLSEQEELMKQALNELQDAQMHAEQKNIALEKEYKTLWALKEEFQSDNNALEESIKKQNELIEQLKAQEDIINQILADMSHEKNLFVEQINQLNQDKNDLISQIEKLTNKKT